MANGSAATTPGRPDLGTLLHALDDPDPQVRREAIVALGEQGFGSPDIEREVAERLADRLHDEDSAVRREAAGMLGFFDHEQAVRELNNLLQVEPDGAVRVEAAFRLIGPDSTQTYDILLDALDDGEPNVRSAAVIALWRLAQMGIEQEQALRAIRSMRVDQDGPVLGSVALALGHIGNQSDVEWVITILANADKGVRAFAAMALGLLGDKRAVEALIDAMLTESDGDVLRFIAGALADLADVRALPTLRTILERDGADSFSGSAAAKAIDSIEYRQQNQVRTQANLD